MGKNCVILKWNPDISSYSMIRFCSDILDKNNTSDWSIYEYDKVKKGDQFFMLKVGTGTCGIVASGEITADPAAGEDWRGTQNIVYYADYCCEIMVNPDKLPIIDSSILEKSITDFNWRGGHSGTVLNELQTAELNRIYRSYLLKNAVCFDKRLKTLAKRGAYNYHLYIDEKLLKQILSQ